MKCVSYLNYRDSGKRVLFSELTQEEKHDVACKLQMQFMKGIGGCEPDKEFLHNNPQYKEYWGSLV